MNDSMARETGPAALRLTYACTRRQGREKRVNFSFHNGGEVIGVIQILSAGPSVTSIQKFHFKKNQSSEMKFQECGK